MRPRFYISFDPISEHESSTATELTNCDVLDLLNLRLLNKLKMAKRRSLLFIIDFFLIREDL